MNENVFKPPVDETGTKDIVPIPDSTNIINRVRKMCGDSMNQYKPLIVRPDTTDWIMKSKAAVEDEINSYRVKNHWESYINSEGDVIAQQFNSKHKGIDDSFVVCSFSGFTGIKRYFCNQVKGEEIISVRWSNKELFILIKDILAQDVQNNDFKVDRKFFNRLVDALRNRNVVFRCKEKMINTFARRLLEALISETELDDRKEELPFSRGWREFADGTRRYIGKDEMTWEEVRQRCI